MKQERHIVSFTALFLFVSCDILSGSEPEYPDDEYVAWVEQIFSGGKQCDPEDDFKPSDTEKLLLIKGIAVFETDKKPLGVCAACSCPSYAAVHYALIHIDKVERAKEIGLELSSKNWKEI